MIKNFTVKVKEITKEQKGIINYYNYLKNENLSKITLQNKKLF